MRRAWLIGLAGGLSLGGAAGWAQQPTPSAPPPRTSQAGAPCIYVVNRTRYMYPVEIKADGRSVATVAVEGGQTRELCLAQPSADGKMLVVLRSFWMPIGSCLLASGERMEIIREGTENDPVTRAYCR